MYQVLLCKGSVATLGTVKSGRCREVTVVWRWRCKMIPFGGCNTFLPNAYFSINELK